MDCQGLDIDETEQTAEVTKFGDTAPMSAHVASGTLTQAIVVTGFVNASVTGLGVAAGDGASGTFTCNNTPDRTVSASYLVHRKHVSGTRIGPFWALTMELTNVGALSTATL